jgi:TonB-linked SusC/RagA family outer membrane protein
MAGHEVQLTRWDGLSGTRFEFPSNQVRELSAGNAETATNGSYAGSSSMESFFGRLNLSYDNRYLLTGNLRGDASSNFAPANRWGVFPSLSVAWRVTNEPFLEGSAILDVVDQFKLRGGYGFIGNQDIGGYRYGDTYTIIPTDFGNSVRSANLGNPGIQWESTESINLGVDVSVLNQRLSLTVDAYQRNVQDLLLNVPLPLYAGTAGVGAITNPLDNIGSMENRGIEFSLNTVNMKGAFRWSTDVIFSMNRNEITALNEPGAVLDRAIEFGTVVSRTRVGEPAAQFYGYVADGLYQNEEQLRNAANNPDQSPWALDAQIDETQGAWIGDVRFRDLDNDGDLDQNDRTFIGNPTPDFTYGITNRFNYKGIDLSVFLNGAYGNDIFNQLRRETANPTADQGMLEEVFNYARIGKIDENGPDALGNLELENPGTDIPRITDTDANDNYRVSSMFVEDGSYLRIQNVTLGYTLPSDLAQRFNLRQFRVYGTVTNLYTFTAYSGYDPEVGAVMSSAADSRTDPLLRGVDTGRYPTPRTFTIGINLGL